MCTLTKIISGGQTGVDQAALKSALKSGLDIGGWCPPGRVSESGIIPLEYPLLETEKERSNQALNIPRSLRTERNVRDSDGVLILLPQSIKIDSGSQWALDCTILYQKPALAADPFANGATETIIHWLRQNQILVLNVAGPAESWFPGIFQKTYTLLLEVFSRMNQ